jgi:basic endochitinase B
LINKLQNVEWDKIFKHRPSNFYSFADFLSAKNRYPKFLYEGTEDDQVRELAAFLANISFETGRLDDVQSFFEWGLFYIKENISDDKKIHYSDLSNTEYPAVPGQTYQGRGPIQLSWNYNYGAFSESWFRDKEVLLRNPDLIASDSVLAFASAIWFWMTPQGPKPSCHDIITGKWKPTLNDKRKGRLPGFGAIINVINGGLECGHTRDRDRMVYREKWFAFFCDRFGVGPGENTSCVNQSPF